MAHALTERKNGFIEFAALGERKAVWHGLGQYLEEGQGISQWKTAAGMDWEIFSSPVMYQAFMETKIDASRQVLFRSDSHDMLSVVSSEYKIVQPGEVLEFFREFTNLNQMKLSAAGTLFGGKRFWATAELGKEAFIVDGDKIEGYLLLVTSADGTLSTQAKFSSTRVVCNNTLNVALSEQNKVVRKTHASQFDAREFKVDLGLIDKGWDNFVTNLKSLADQKVVQDEANEFFARLVNPKNDSAMKESLGYIRQMQALQHFYKNGSGAEMSHGTKWGLLNAVTEMHTHGSGRSGADSQFDKSEFGKGASVKQEALDLLLCS